MGSTRAHFISAQSCDVLFFHFFLLTLYRPCGQPSSGDEWFAEGAALSLQRSFRDSQGRLDKDKRSSQVCLYVTSHVCHSNCWSACFLWSATDTMKIYLFVSCLVFLSSELQAAQIMKSRPVLDKDEGSPVCQDLLAICNTLSLPQSRGQDTAGVFSQVQDRVGLFNVVEAHFYQGQQEWPVRIIIFKLADDHWGYNHKLWQVTNRLVGLLSKAFLPSWHLLVTHGAKKCNLHPVYCVFYCFPLYGAKALYSVLHGRLKKYSKSSQKAQLETRCWRNLYPVNNG